MVVSLLSRFGAQTMEAESHHERVRPSIDRIVRRWSQGRPPSQFSNTTGSRVTISWPRRSGSRRALRDGRGGKSCERPLLRGSTSVDVQHEPVVLAVRFDFDAGNTLEVAVASENRFIPLDRGSSDCCVTFPDPGAFVFSTVSHSLTE